jgi:polyhydroxybutyrate depolymerase
MKMGVWTLGRTTIATMVLTGCFAAILSVPDLAAQETKETMTLDNVDRSYVVHLPKGYDDKQHYPVVILLHGMNQDSDDMERLTRFNELADKDSIIAVYPSALHGRWNFGIQQSPQQQYRRGPYRRPGYGYPGRYPGGGGGYPPPQREPGERNRPQQADDVDFLNRMLDRLANKFAVDRARVYVTGLSDGGFMTLKVGCELADRVAAIGIVGAAMPKTMVCIPSRPLPAVMMNGTDDPVVKYGGGTGKNGRFATISAEDTAKQWAKYDRCAEKPAKSKVPAHGKGSMETKVDTFTGCQQDAAVVLYSIKGGGNTWPGGEQYESEKTIGKTSEDLDANSTLWSFFVTRKLPDAGAQK